MNRQQQGRNYPSGHYQTSNPYPPPQQYGHSSQPPPNTYNDRTPSHHVHSSYPESSLQSLQPPPPGQGHGNRSPYMGTVPFPEPQFSSAGPPQSYLPSSQTTPNLSVGTHHQYEHQGSHGHFPATGSLSDNQRLYPAGASQTGGGSKFYPTQPGVQPHHGGGYTATTAPPQPPQPPQDLKAPPNRPTNARDHPLCRFPRCNRSVFFDRRVNELREWCSDQHMLDAITYGVEKPCNTCRVWPRRYGYKRCSVDRCRYPYPQNHGGF